MELVNELIGIQFKGFPATLRWDKIFLWLQITFETNCPHGDLLRVYLRPFISHSISYRNVYEEENIFMGAIQLSRTSYITHFDKFCDLGSFDRIYTASGKIKFNAVNGLRLILKYIPAWRKELAKTNLCRNQKNGIISSLIHFWYFQKTIGHIQYKKYRLFVSFFDAEPDGAFMRELFRIHGVPTASLQHGQFVAWRENVLENSGVEFRCFNSDYLLCWNKFTIDEALKHGIDKNKLALCGILGYIGTMMPPKCVPPHNQTFGVVLGHPIYEEENYKLIQAANILAKEKNLKYFLKLHPNYEENRFDNMVDSRYYVGNTPKGIPMSEYAESVDFSLIGSSSVFTELVYISHDVIRYSDFSSKDKFRDINIGKIFHTPEEIVEVFNENENRDYSEELFDYVCSVKNVTESYQNFLSHFVQ